MSFFNELKRRNVFRSEPAYIDLLEKYGPDQ
jgi:hypothetical protein